MRYLIASILLSSTPAAAWEATSDGPVCLLSHATEDAEVVVSFDPRNALPYAIDLARIGTQWGAAPVFVMRFDGSGPLTITTDRHRLSQGNERLTVTDRGFDNVLNGIAFNQIAIAMLGDDTTIIPLFGAAPEVEKFRSCVAAPSA